MEARTGEPNPGNYGVLYKIRLELTNPGYDEKAVRISLFPTAGVARGAFVIDGKRVNVPITPPYEEVVLASYRLPSGSRRIVEILTTPEGGSYYPVNLIVKPE
ncbi:MAG: hypothetical protein HYU64_07750 [Armatimonadetes bacterium]|nr:hypothetical protein [Armatimonadota bacterium]